MINNPAHSDFGDFSSVVEVEETTYIAEFIYSKNGLETHWQIVFEYGTFNSSSQLQVKTLSADYQLDINNNYLEQLKLAIKVLLKPNWENIIWLMDKDSEQLSIELYPSVYRVENLARQLSLFLISKGTYASHHPIPYSFVIISLIPGNK